ncbi:MAG: hypothetical protein J6T10_30030 [Methanobrevibacter sp.]|nr:hypothetical protein [Methanobrevibacter sp.]
MVRDDFVCFILTHGRADNVITYKTLKRCGYTGNTIIVIDNEDDQAEKYYEVFGKENVYMFDKLKKSKEFDTGDSFDNRKAIVYARNACFDIARELGYKYFLELDDDYTTFMHRWIEDGKFKSRETKNLDDIINAFVNFMEKTNVKTIAFAQGGDFIGGADNDRFKEGLLRKAMNSFFCSVDRPFDFVGRVNEDVNTYTTMGQRGDLLFTYTGFMLNQKQTQSNKGGMTDLYLDSGTFLKSFYTVMYSPSCCKIASMGDKHKRIHHKVDWGNCCPKILNKKWKKEKNA